MSEWVNEWMNEWMSSSIAKLTMTGSYFFKRSYSKQSYVVKQAQTELWQPWHFLCWQFFFASNIVSMFQLSWFSRCDKIDVRTLRTVLDRSEFWAELLLPLLTSELENRIKYLNDPWSLFVIVAQILALQRTRTDQLSAHASSQYASERPSTSKKNDTLII